MSQEITEMEIREGLARGLWEEYQKPDISRAEKIKIAGLLARLTDDVEDGDEGDEDE